MASGKESSNGYWLRHAMSTDARWREVHRAWVEHILEAVGDNGNVLIDLMNEANFKHTHMTRAWIEVTLDIVEAWEARTGNDILVGMDFDHWYKRKDPGITFLQSAESHTEAYDWLAEAERHGWNVDVLFKPGQYQGARSVMRYLKGRDYFHVPIHEYELMHHGGGNRTTQLLKDGGRMAFNRKRAMPRLWGEDYLLTFPLQ